MTSSKCNLNLKLSDIDCVYKLRRSNQGLLVCIALGKSQDWEMNWEMNCEISDGAGSYVMNQDHGAVGCQGGLESCGVCRVRGPGG